MVVYPINIIGYCSIVIPEKQQQINQAIFFIAPIEALIRPMNPRHVEQQESCPLYVCMQDCGPPPGIFRCFVWWMLLDV